MTRLPAPEQWVLSTMSEMETAEMIEQHIDYYTEDEEPPLSASADAVRAAFHEAER